MKRVLFIFLFVFMVGCSSNQMVPVTETFHIIPTSSPLPTQTAILPTQVSNPTSTPVPTMTITSTPIGGSGKIAFTSEENGSSDIYVINSDGTNLIKLANNITPKFAPAWSPDGKKIAFASITDDSAGLYIMNADGSNPIKLLDTKEVNNQDVSVWRFNTDCCHMAWSPDGKVIVFSAAHHSYNGCCRSQGEIYLVDINGKVIENPTGNDFPIWSPNSQKIAFDSGNCGGSLGICIMDADGRNLVNIANGIGYGGKK